MLQAILAIGLLAFFVFMYYWRNMTEFGSDIARHLLPQNIFVGLLFVLGVNLSWPLLAVFMTVYAFVAWFFWLKYMLRPPQAGQTLYRWARTMQTGEIVATVAAVLLGVFLVAGGLARQSHDVEASYVGLVLLALMPVMVVERTPCLTEDGVDTGRDYVRWAQIESYRWSESVKPMMHLFFKTSRRLSMINLVQLDVPYEEKDAVSEIVLRKVQHIPAVRDETSVTS